MTLVTEKEAAEKWCPYAKTLVLQTDTDGTVHGAAVNRTFELSLSGAMSEPVAGTRCIGSNCMAWRWNEPPGPRSPDDMREPDIRGYCGAF